MSIVTIIGAGSWGTALAQLLDDNGHTAKLYDISPERIQEINERHTNEKYLPGIKLSETI
ncbi:MAG: glycerol-3-phosphate dehydrogenase, partial [Bacillaceae bacterium]|nr:glycerol-3-phosphate dehydrogenase [Bacillaceae bacterium]